VCLPQLQLDCIKLLALWAHPSEVAFFVCLNLASLVFAFRQQRECMMAAIPVIVGE
jgi:hypothetical protein